MKQAVRILFAALAMVFLAGCITPFFHQERQFVVEAEDSLTPIEQREVFESFKARLRKEGRTAFFERQADGVSTVTFRIRRIGYGPESDLFADLLDLKYAEGRVFSLKVYRHTYTPSDFTGEGLATFIAETEASIQAASGRRVHLRLSTNGT